MEVSTQFPVTSEVWGVSMEWSNFTTDWDLNDTTEIFTTEKVIRPPLTPPITGTRFAMAILMSVIIPVSIFGNSAVLAAIMKTRSLQRPNTMMYISLSVSDVMRTLFCMPFFTYALYTNDWEIPEQLCPFYHALYIMVRFVSVMNLTVISLERYIIITHPLLYHRKATKTRMVQLIAVIWSISFLYGTLNILWFFDLDSDNNNYIKPDIEKKIVNIPCRFDPKLGFAIFDFILTFLIPLSIMFGVYLQIFLVVRAQMKKIQPQINKSYHKDGRELTFYERPSSGIPDNLSINKTTNKRTSISDFKSSSSHKDYDDVENNNANDKAKPDRNSYQLENISKSSIHTDEIVNYDNNPCNVLRKNPKIVTEEVPTSQESDPNMSDSDTTTQLHYDKNTLRPLHKTERMNTNNNRSNQNDSEDGYSLKSRCSVTLANEENSFNNNIEKITKDTSENKAIHVYRKNSASFKTSRSQHNFHYKNKKQQSNTSLESIDESSTSSYKPVTRQYRSNTFEHIENRPRSPGKKSHNKAVKLSIGVIGTFVLCFAPSDITFVIERACTTCVGDIAWMTVNTLAMLSSAVNPFVYSLYSSEFRKAMQTLVICKKQDY